MLVAEPRPRQSTMILTCGSQNFKDPASNSTCWNQFSVVCFAADSGNRVKEKC